MRCRSGRMELLRYPYGMSIGILDSLVWRLVDIKNISFNNLTLRENLVLQKVNFKLDYLL
ncbi:MAG: hypothetical protein ACLT41_05660 [Fusobacterium sp.]